MTEKVHASLDRIEEGWLVCYTDDDRRFLLPEADFPGFRGGEAVMLAIDGDRATGITLLAEETAENAEKTKRLFSALLRKKNNKENK